MERECDNCEAFEQMKFRIFAGDEIELFACSEACKNILDWRDATVELIASEKERNSDGRDA